MFGSFKNKTSKNDKRNVSAERIFDGCAYVIGDIHGCFDELIALLKLVEADIAIQTDGPKYIVFLGDLMDRGPQSKQVIDYLIDYKLDGVEVIFLMGNHEEFFLDVLLGPSSKLLSWFDFGGRECSRSYGVANLGEVHTNPDAVLARLQSKVPRSHIDFINGFKDSFQLGPYLCVHAGIKPQVPIEDQTSQDMRWIRSEFMRYKKPHPLVIVHGHTIVERVDILSNRIAVDTGVYNTGRLSAVRLNRNGEHIIETPGNERGEK